MDIGSSLVVVTCPKCGKQFQEPLRRFHTKDNVHCPQCHHGMQLELENPEEFRKAQALLDPKEIAKKLGGAWKKR